MLSITFCRVLIPSRMFNARIHIYGRSQTVVSLLLSLQPVLLSLIPEHPSALSDGCPSCSNPTITRLRGFGSPASFFQGIPGAAGFIGVAPTALLHSPACGYQFVLGMYFPCDTKRQDILAPLPQTRTLMAGVALECLTNRPATSRGSWWQVLPYPWSRRSVSHIPYRNTFRPPLSPYRVLFFRTSLLSLSTISRSSALYSSRSDYCV